MSTASERRERTIQRVRGLLHRRGFPYLQMTLLVAATGLAGFLASALLRWAGLSWMGVRYPLCVGISWLCFIGMIGIWVAFHRRAQRRKQAGSSMSELGNPLRYDGDVYLDIGASATPARASAASGSSSKGGGIGLGNIDGDGALLVVVILIVVAVIAAIAASLFVIFEAPILFAEVLVDGALLAGVARSLRRRPQREHWTAGVLRRTWKPALVLLVVFTAVGFGLQYFVPKATTMGEAVRMVRENR